MPLAPLDATTGAAATARAWTARNALGSPGWTRKRWYAVKSYSWRTFWERERRNLAGHRAARCWAYNRERLIISALIYVRGTDCWSWKLALPSTDCISLRVILYWTGTLNCSLVLRCFNHEAMRQAFDPQSAWVLTRSVYAFAFAVFQQSTPELFCRATKG